MGYPIDRSVGPIRKPIEVSPDNPFMDKSGKFLTDKQSLSDEEVGLPTRGADIGEF
jgi:hypothetical protein